MKNIFYTITAIFLTLAANAQEQQTSQPIAVTPTPSASKDDAGLHFGLKAAPSLAWLKTDTKGFENDGMKFGFSYGLMTEFNITNRYAFATGIDVTYRGGKLKSSKVLKSTLNTDSTVISDTRYTIQYIEIPLTLKLKTNEIGYLTYFFQAGLTPGFNIRSRANLKISSQTKDVSGNTINSNFSEDRIDIDKDINFLNLSMVIGAGFEYTISGSTVLLTGIEFNNGFLDVFDSNDVKANSNFLALKLGMLF